MIVMSKARRRKSHIAPDDVKARDETEGETEDIYDAKQRERMLEEDEITVAEEGFMIGRDEPPNKKETRKKSHDDSISVELAKQDAEED